MKVETKNRKKAMKGFRQMTGSEYAKESLYRIMVEGKLAMDALFRDMGKMLAESVLLMEREELAGPDYYPTDPKLQKWSHEAGSVYIGDQKVKIQRPRLRHTEMGEVPLKSYKALRSKGQFSQALLEKMLCGVSTQKYQDTVLAAAQAFGISPSSVSKRIVEASAAKLQEFQNRALSDFMPFVIFLDTVHEGGEAFINALGVNGGGDKKPLGFWQGSSENHEICEALFKNLESRGLKLSHRIIFVTDGGSGIIKALKDRFGKKLLHQRCVIHKSRNLQKHLAEKYRKEAHQLFTNALEQNSYEDAKEMLKALEKWLRAKNESAADSLQEAFEELLTMHRLKVPKSLRKTLMTTNPIESMFSLVRVCQRNVKRPRDSKMLQRWLASALLYCEKQFNRLTGYKDIDQVIKNIDLAFADPIQSFEKAA